MDNKRKALGPPAADAPEDEEPEKKRKRLDADEYEELITRFSTREAWIPYSKSPRSSAFSFSIGTHPPEMRLEDEKNYLNLSSIGLVLIPEALWRWKLVDGFTVTGGRWFGSIPPGSIENWHGTSLSFARCVIRVLPAELSTCANLKSLCCKSNPISVAPPELSMCKSLSHLDLSYTYIESIPREWGNMRSLASLDLEGTRVGRLPVRLGKCKDLKMVRMPSSILVIDGANGRRYVTNSWEAADTLKAQWRLVERKFFRALFATKGEEDDDDEHHLMSQLPLELKQYIYSLL
jgi:Leucine-rich repeat (LRR) protein